MSDEVTTITYFFSDSEKDGSTYTWTTDLSIEEANDIKNAYADSMKNWNNVYYYSYDASGHMVVNKVINIVEGQDKESSNLIIYPTNSSKITSEEKRSPYMATTGHDDENSPIQPVEEIAHHHYEKWYMKVNLDYFVSSYYYSYMSRQRTGAHELGHVLGVYDVDVCCTASGDYGISSDGHHGEILMGYDSPRSTYAKYKDIAGVSITRGFHTDADHKWMIRTKDDGSRYLICALCNGTRTNFTLENGMYEGQMPVEFGSCGDNHSLDSGNMLLVATDCERDFYKCMKCRYIEEVPHNHISNSWTRNTNEHIGVCTTCNIEVTVPHNWSYTSNITGGHTKTCSDCGYSKSESHVYGYTCVNTDTHKGICSLCGYESIEDHYFNCTYVDADTHSGVCRECGHEATLSHSYEYAVVNANYHILTCKCGATSGSNSGHIWTSVPGAINYVKCKQCHYQKSNAGGNIPIIKTKPIIIEEETE